MKLYVCWGMFSPPAGHSCRKAYEALKQAGYEPEVVKSYGSASLPDFMNTTEGRREGKRLISKTTLPVLVTDNGEVVAESRNIARWAMESRSGQADRSSGS
jgi:glutathione S-transferase